MLYLFKALISVQVIFFSSTQGKEPDILTPMGNLLKKQKQINKTKQQKQNKSKKITSGSLSSSMQTQSEEM